MSDTGWDLEHAALRGSGRHTKFWFCRITPESLEGSNAGQRKREYQIVVCLQSLKFSVSIHPNKGKRNHISFLE